MMSPPFSDSCISLITQPTVKPIATAAIVVVAVAAVKVVKRMNGNDDSVPVMTGLSQPRHIRKTVSSLLVAAEANSANSRSSVNVSSSQ